MAGLVGTGKTWHLWKIAETLISGGWLGRMEIASMYEIKKATDRPLNEEALDRWRSAQILAIDDIGASAINDWTADALGELIDTRWQYSLPTIVATNELKLGPLLGERVVSRLADGATVVEFVGTDFRKATGK
jgi:DNA replication protein DnaC